MQVVVSITPFGQDVIPHEKTYKGPIEDRLKLMRATGMQLSPIFGLFSDSRNELTRLLYSNLARPEVSGTLDGDCDAEVFLEGRSVTLDVDQVAFHVDVPEPEIAGQRARAPGGLAGDRTGPGWSVSQLPLRGPGHTPALE